MNKAFFSAAEDFSFMTNGINSFSPLEDTWNVVVHWKGWGKHTVEIHLVSILTKMKEMEINNSKMEPVN